MVKISHTIKSIFFTVLLCLYYPYELTNKLRIYAGICHTCVTYRGDDVNWESLVKETGWGGVNKYLIFFTDYAGLTWDKKPMVETMSETIEMFIGDSCCFTSHTIIMIALALYKIIIITTSIIIITIIIVIIHLLSSRPCYDVLPYPIHYRYFQSIC